MEEEKKYFKLLDVDYASETILGGKIEFKDVINTKTDLRKRPWNMMAKHIRHQSEVNTPKRVRKILKCLKKELETRNKITINPADRPFALKIARFMDRVGPVFMVRRKGLCYYCPHLSMNDTDPVSMVELIDIQRTMFFSAEDNGNYYSFDLQNLKPLIENPGTPTNPYSNLPFSERFLVRAAKRILRLSLIGYEIETEKYVPKTPEDEIRVRTETILTKMDKCGWITNSEWFLKLKNDGLCQFYLETEDIIYHRAELSKKALTELEGSGGKLFPLATDLKNDPNIMSKLTLYVSQNLVLEQMDRLVTVSADRNGNIGMDYVIMGLTQCSEEARAAFPFMYQPP
jgi:hypothetical protein